MRVEAAGRGFSEDWPSEHVQQRRAENEADENLAGDRGLSEAVRGSSTQLGGGDDERQQQQDLEEMRH